MSEIFKLDHPITCHAWNKDRTQLAISPDNHEVYIYKLIGKEWTITDVLSQHELRVTGIDWAGNTNRLVTSSMDRNAYVWTLDKEKKWKPELVLLRINRAATCVKWSPLENKFAVGSGSRLIAVCYFEAENKWWVAKHIKKPIRSTITTLDWHPNNNLLVAGATDYRVRVFSAYFKEIDKETTPTLWGTKTPFGQMLAEMKNSQSGGGWILGVNFSADGNKVSWVGRDSSINVAVAVGGGGAPIVTKLKTDELPFEACIWISPTLILCSGHNCNPKVYSFNNTNITLHAKLDREQIQAGQGKLSAFKKFQNIADTSQSDTLDKNLPTIHQTSIKCMCLYNGDKGKAKKVSTSALDRQLVIWDLETMQTVKK
jgi:actin related protein 2/3 complex, subunit 1A/1B